MYATAKNSIPPLGLEDKVKLEYRCDGSSTFFAFNCQHLFNTSDDFYKQFIFYTGLWSLWLWLCMINSYT